MTIGFAQGYALIVGVANYPRVRPLPMEVLQDAGDTYNLLASPEHCGYLPANIRLLLDNQATRAGLVAGLGWLAEVAGEGDTVLFFFSGHGGRLESGAQPGNYLIPYDAEACDLAKTALYGDEFTSLIEQIRVQRLLILFDCCYAGGIGVVKDLEQESETFKSGLAESYYERLAQGSGRVIMASSRSDETSLILPGMANSLFTNALLEALRGKARTRGDGLVRVFDVFEYISETVPTKGKQHPIFKAADLENNFPISLHLGGKKSLAPEISSTEVDKRLLREGMIQAFSQEELEILCADVEQALTDKGVQLQVNPEMVGGSSKPAKILNLINYLERRGHLAVLVEAVRRARPGII